MRVYVPATFDALAELADNSSLQLLSPYAFAVTPALTRALGDWDDDERDDAAFQDAARASIRLLSGGVTRCPHRRVVLTCILNAQPADVADAEDSLVDLGSRELRLKDVLAIHVDLPEAEPDTGPAVGAIAQADLGDMDAEHQVQQALDNLMAWYDPQELADLLAEVATERAGASEE